MNQPCQDLCNEEDIPIPLDGCRRAKRRHTTAESGCSTPPRNAPGAACPGAAPEVIAVLPGQSWNPTRGLPRDQQRSPRAPPRTAHGRYL